MFFKRRKKTVQAGVSKDKEIVEVEQEKVWKKKGHDLGFIGVGNLGIRAVSQIDKSTKELPIRSKSFAITTDRRSLGHRKGWDEALDLSGSTIQGVGVNPNIAKKLLDSRSEDYAKFVDNLDPEDFEAIFVFFDNRGTAAGIVPTLMKDLSENGLTAIPVLFLPPSSEGVQSQANAADLVHNLALSNGSDATLFLIDVDLYLRRQVDKDAKTVLDMAVNDFIDDFIVVLSDSIRPSNDVEFHAGYQELLSVCSTGKGIGILAATDATSSGDIKASEMQVFPALQSQFENNGHIVADLLTTSKAYVCVEVYKTMQTEIEVRRIPKTLEGQLEMKVIYSDVETQPLRIHGVFTGVDASATVDKLMQRAFGRTNERASAHRRAEIATLEAPRLHDKGSRIREEAADISDKETASPEECGSEASDDEQTTSSNGATSQQQGDETVPPEAADAQSEQDQI